jgi:aldehyde dehydrogenase
MSLQVDEQRISAIVQKVVAELRQERPVSNTQPPISNIQSPSVQDGVFPDIDSAIAAAQVAHKRLMALPVERRDVIISQMRQAARENAQVLAHEAWQETGMGRYEDKIQKNLLVANKTPGTEDLKPLAFTGDHGLTLVERAPYGVIGAITPSTNPTSTIICNAIGMVAAGNGVVFNCHPGAKKVSVHTVQILNQAIVRAGGPPNLIATIPEPTIESAQYVMKHPTVDLLVVTGGPGVVEVAMNSGKNAICAGPGNPPVVVDETADIEQAARDIIKGASFDNNIICVLEKEIIAVDAIADQLKAAMLARGVIELSLGQLNRLMKVILQEDHGPGKHGVINKTFVGKNVSVILKEIGMRVDDAVSTSKQVRLAIAEVDRLHPLVWTEQLMPIIPLVRVASADEAIDLAKEVEQGMGHTAVMHSKHLDHLSRMAREINTSIFVKNAPSVAGLGFGGEGYTSFSIASPTGEGVTSAKDFSRVRRCTLVEAFRIV